MTLTVLLSLITITTIIDYHCIIIGINKSEAINILKNSDFRKYFWFDHVWKINKDIRTLRDLEIEERKFNYSKYPININNADVDKMIICDKASLLETKMMKKLSRYV